MDMNLRKIAMQKELTGNNPQQILFAEEIPTKKILYLPNSKREKLENKFKNLIHEELKLGSVVSYVGNKNSPFLRIYRYKEAFTFDFVMGFLRRFEADSTDYVFDPFSGLGTTMYTSMIYGIPSVGIDKLPIAYFSSKTLPLLLLLKENELKEIWTSLTPKIQKSEPAEVALDVPIMKVAFDEQTLLTLRKLKSAIDDLSNPYRDIFLLLFFSILEECSFTSKDGQFLRLNRNKKISSPIDAMNRKIAQVEEDVRRMKLLSSDIPKNDKFMPDVYLADTRDLSDIRFKKKPTIIILLPHRLMLIDMTIRGLMCLSYAFILSRTLRN